MNGGRSGASRRTWSRHGWLLGLVVVAMAILHQDVWFWDDQRLVLGFVPIGLAYHALFSIVAACVWAAAVRFAWPAELERWATDGTPDETQITREPS